MINADVVIAEFATERALVTSEGARTYSFSPRAELSVGSRRRAKAAWFSCTKPLEASASSRTGTRRSRSFAAVVDELREDLRRKAEGVFCEAGVHDVVLDSDVAGILAHEAIGHTCEGDLVLAGSVVAGRIGEQVASEKITLVDQVGRGFDGGASIAIHVDDEGTACRDTPIIEKGVLKGYLHTNRPRLISTRS